MKNIKLLCLSFVAVAAFSCKNTNKENSHDAEHKNGSEHSHDGETTQFSLVSDSTKVSFIAYKTTEKLPVGGTFKTINITNSTPGATALEAMNGTEFSIPVSSLFTNDPTGTRDPKLLEFFFGVMKNTELISGILKVDGSTYSLEATLNGETSTIPLQAEFIAENKYILTGVMNLENWKALDAVAALNKACEALHTGADGVSKTWNEVAVKAEVLLLKK
ncbi:hypothetical protein MWU65_07270 [Cellulophaga sp. F20128]|uniref:hypothetical protein n=1 Tax=Cellulophaga sp. F20128 TaxID=2926413 RepID=UPI001FF642B9|nr:hypothetical protein [Cellulophaga sp. F20128]MCK0156975.1 hypothetical protein [Cellulophaga sp. F20128]